MMDSESIESPYVEKKNSPVGVGLEPEDEPSKEELLDVESSIFGTLDEETINLSIQAHLDGKLDQIVLHPSTSLEDFKKI